MANNPTLLTQPIAANGAKNVIPNTTSTVGAMSQDQGFPAETALPLGAGGVAPSREDFNGAFNLLSGIAFMAQKGWVFLFDENQNYFAGCMVRDPLDSKIYEAINDVPASITHPSADSVNWKEFGNPDLSNYANKQLSNLDTANLACHVVVDSYYDSTTGDWYRVYDDGWVEQGGRYSGNVNDTITVNLNKPFADTLYTVYKTFDLSTRTTRPYSGTFSLHYICVWGLTTTTFLTEINSGNTGQGTIGWFACGKGA